MRGPYSAGTRNFHSKRGRAVTLLNCAKLFSRGATRWEYEQRSGVAYIQVLNTATAKRLSKRVPVCSQQPNLLLARVLISDPSSKISANSDVHTCREKVFNTCVQRIDAESRRRDPLLERAEKVERGALSVLQYMWTSALCGSRRLPCARTARSGGYTRPVHPTDLRAGRKGSAKFGALNMTPPPRSCARPQRGLASCQRGRVRSDRALTHTARR